MCKKFKFDHTNKWYMHYPAPVLENDTQTMGLWRTNGSPNLGKKTRPNNYQQKKEKLQNCRLCRPGWPQNKTWRKVKRKISTSTLQKNWKKKRRMRVTIIPIVIGAFGTVTKGLLKGLEDLEVGGQVATIKTTTLLRTARILKRVLKTWEDLLFLKLQWKIIS